jgi:hypothetical protein
MPDDFVETVLIEPTCRENSLASLANVDDAPPRRRAERVVDWYCAVVIISALVALICGLYPVTFLLGHWVNYVFLVAVMGCGHWLMLPYIISSCIAGWGYEDGSGLSLEWHILFRVIVVPYIGCLVILAWRRLRAHDLADSFLPLCGASVALFTWECMFFIHRG